MLSLEAKQLTRWGLILAIIILAWAAARVTWPLLAPPYRLPAPSVADRGGERAKTTDYAQAISVAQLMGSPKRVVKAPKPVRAPAARTNLELLGLYDLADDDGYAILRANRQDEALYRRGEKLPGGARLVAVWPQFIELETDGRRESLSLEQEGMPNSARPKLVAPAKRGLGEKLIELRDQIKQNPAQLGQMLRATPSWKDGRMRGLILRPRNNDPLFTEIGLQPGDLLVELNGIVLDKPAQGAKVLRELGKANEINAVVERGGRRLTISHRLGQ